MIGAPTFIARSMTLQIFSAYASDSEPPKTVKSWLKTNTSRPSMRAVAGDDAVAEDALLVEAEVGRAVGHERVELDERARVEQQLEPLARRQLAPRVLLLDPRLLRRRAAIPRASAAVARSVPRSSTRPPYARARLCARTAAHVGVRACSRRFQRTRADASCRHRYASHDISTEFGEQRRVVWITPAVACAIGGVGWAARTPSRGAAPTTSPTGAR